MKKTLYLSSWINFGKYKNNPRQLKEIADTKEGRGWMKWMSENSCSFDFDHTAIEYMKLQEEDARYILQPQGSKQ